MTCKLTALLICCLLDTDEGELNIFPKGFVSIVYLVSKLEQKVHSLWTLELTTQGYDSV